MGSFSLTAVNAFGDPRAAQLASARLVDRGYPVVAAARLGDIAIRNGLLAIIGAAHDHERMIAISARMHDRVAALAVVGGPLAILLGQHEGLTMPTLVVSDRVGRRDRRRIVRRLPRGSMVVRAVEFDAALDAVVTFLDRTAEGRRQPIGNGTLRPIALRLAPAAFFAPAAAVILAGSGAEAAATCTHEREGGLITITCDGVGADLTLSATSDDLILLDGEVIAKLSETQKISILTTSGDDKLTIDGLIDKLRSAPEGAAIAFDVDGGGGLDELNLITGLPAVQLTADKISLIDETKLLGEINYAGFDKFSYLGDETASKMEINGLNFAKLDLAGGGGDDSLKLISGDGLIKITEESLSLNFAEIDIQYKEYKEVAVVGDKLASKMEIADFSGLVKLDVDGGGGGDELSLIRGLPAVQLTADKLLLADVDLKLSGEINYAGFDKFSYLGDETASKMEINGLNFAKLDLAGGGGDDSLKLISGDGLIKITEESLSLNFAEIDIQYKEYKEVAVVGDELASKMEIADFSGLVKLDVDGGGGGDELSLIRGLPAVQLTADKLLLADVDLKLAGEIKYAGFDKFSYLGDGTASEIELVDTINFAKLDLDGGGGGDKLRVTSDASLIAITDSALNFSKIEIDYKEFAELNLIGGIGDSKVEINGLNFAKLDLAGGGGDDSLKLISGDGLIKITEESLSLNFAEIDIQYKEYKEVAVVGDELASKMEIADFSGLVKLDVDGGGGGDELSLIRGLPAVQLTADKLLLADVDLKLAGEIKYAGFDKFSYLGDGTASEIELVDTINFAKLDLDGGGGGDKLRVTSDASLIAITDSALNFSKIEIDYKEFAALSVIGGAGDNKFELKEFTGLVTLSLNGGGGFNEMKFSTGQPLLNITESEIASLDPFNPIAHEGFKHLVVLAATDIANTFDGSKVETLKLTLDGGSKDDILLGGALDDLLTGGFGTNKISGGGGNDTLAETVDGNFVASNNTLSGAGLDAFSSIEALALTGGAGDNSFNTEPFKGKVTLDGGAGNDRMISGPSVDVLIGGPGNDSLNGGQGDDTLLAGDGDDTLNGGPGTDFGDGGPGTDTGKSIERPLSIER